MIRGESMTKLTESQEKAFENWEDANEQRKEYINNRTVTHNFIKHWATRDDLDDLFNLILDRHEFLQGNKSSQKRLNNKDS